MAMEQFKQSVFDAIQLDNVIWVDDRFSNKNNSIVTDYLESIKAMAEVSPEKISDFPHITANGIDVSLPFELWEGTLPTHDEAITDYYNHIEQCKPDFTTTEFNELIELFENNSKGTINKLSLEDWNKQKAQWLSSNNRNMFLIDYNFEHEGESTTYGKIIIEEILKKADLTNIYCVLFTSEADHGKEEEEKRNSIINQLDVGCNNHNFSVLSKSIISDEEEVCLNFKASEFVKRIFLRKLSSEMVESLSTSLSLSIEELKRDLSQHSIYEIDRSIFSNSLAEGASELELLHRLFTIKQQQSINKLLSNESSIIRKLSSFRSVQTVAFKGAENKKYKNYLDKVIPVSNKFANLRVEEIFDNAINSIHSPLSSGDIFEFSGKNYILIEQACDLSVRGFNGTRKLKEAILIPFEEREIKNSTAKEKESFSKKVELDKFYLLKIPNHKSNNFYCLFDFSEAITVNINWLDLCVFNTSGTLKIEYSPEFPDLLHLPGWRIKYKAIVQKLKPYPVQVQSHYQSVNSILNSSPITDLDDIKRDFAIFSMTSDKRFETSVSLQKLEMQGKRTRRLKESFMELLSRAYFIGYKTRGALGNDFSN
ncbi:hypothetical protein J4H40_15055 [Vibrio alginolyticus]|uniref:hypothetical protein n=1 Tax=Vibrio alginolyticus TaxID=663 RepID=UPI001BD63A9D|nr:hypothetical protein [Vibrio alginolyticus]MBT0030762.1 hypothetical protein [Vibrio alginolyticus]